MDVLNFFLVCIILLIVILAIYFVYIYNHLVRLKNRVEETWKQIDVRLQNRYDLLPDLIQAVEKAVQTDKEIQTKIAELRSAINAAKKINNNLNSINDKVNAEKSIDSILHGIQISVEAYPELRSQESIQNFIKENTIIEEKIAAARQIYNVTAREYNEGIQVFPNNIIANIFGYRKIDYFESTPDAKKDIKPTWGGTYTTD